MRAVSAGIFCLHQLNTVHMDLKSLNILITSDRKAKIADLGEPAYTLFFLKNISWWQALPRCYCLMHRCLCSQNTLQIQKLLLHQSIRAGLGKMVNGAETVATQMGTLAWTGLFNPFLHISRRSRVQILLLEPPFAKHRHRLGVRLLQKHCEYPFRWTIWTCVISVMYIWEDSVGLWRSTD